MFKINNFSQSLRVCLNNIFIVFLFTHTVLITCTLYMQKQTEVQKDTIKILWYSHLSL